ncbi:MAG: archaemetzincin [Planctomycetota bacterium]
MQRFLLGETRDGSAEPRNRWWLGAHPLSSTFQCPRTIQLLLAACSAQRRQILRSLVPVITNALTESFPLAVSVQTSRALGIGELAQYVEGYYEEASGQYVLPFALRTAREEVPTLILTDIDLTGETTRGYLKNYLHGRVYYPNRNIGIVSTFRLRSEHQAVFQVRMIKTVIHELAHLFGIATPDLRLSDDYHCKNRNCVMRFSPTTAGLDETGFEFCRECLAKIAARYQRGR